MLQNGVYNTIPHCIGLAKKIGSGFSIRSFIYMYMYVCVYIYAYIYMYVYIYSYL